MITVLTAGALVGAGVFLLIRAMFPARPSLSLILARVDGLSAPGAVRSSEASTWWAARVGPAVARTLDHVGVSLGPLGADLAVIGRSVEDHMAYRAAASSAAIVGVGAVATILGFAGVSSSFLATAWLALGAALVGFVIPDSAVRRRAAERRRSFRQALAFFLDLVVVILSAGAGVGSAVRQAAEAGDGWAHGQLRAALTRGRVRREPPWMALGQLGTELGITELEELASAVSLAERDGASVRQTLSAKAASIRDHQLADAEAEASSATVRMTAPLVLLGIAFCGFVLYGAVMSVFVGA